jgi:PPOX class probable F420-dependent enzyme
MARAKLTPTQRRLFEAPNIGHLATAMPDGSPQVSPVWVDVDGDDILVNTAERRLKAENLHRDPRVAISITDADDPFTMVAVRGRAVLEHEGADESIDALARKYTGAQTYQGRNPEERRVLIRITPEHVAAMGRATARVA